MGKFVIRRVGTGYKFDLSAANGEIVASSEAYTTLAACKKGIESVKRYAPQAPLVDLTACAGRKSGARFELYADRAGAFRFRLMSRNGAIIAVSEPYRNQTGCESGIESVRQSALNAEIEIVR